MLSPSKDKQRKRSSPSSSDDNNVKTTPQTIKSSGLSSPLQTLRNLWNGTTSNEDETPSKKSKKQDDTQDISFITSSPNRKPGKGKIFHHDECMLLLTHSSITTNTISSKTTFTEKPNSRFCFIRQ